MLQCNTFLKELEVCERGGASRGVFQEGGSWNKVYGS